MAVDQCRARSGCQTSNIVFLFVNFSPNQQGIRDIERADKPPEPVGYGACRTICGAHSDKMADFFIILRFLLVNNDSASLSSACYYR